MPSWNLAWTFEVVSKTRVTSEYIENADATPPHLEVFPAVGKLSGFAGFVQIFAVNSSELVFIPTHC